MIDDMNPGAEEEIDPGELHRQWEQYAETQNEIDRSNVVDIRKGVKSEKEKGYSDTELFPKEPSDVFFDRMIFDAEQSLIDSASQKWIVDGIIPADGFGILYGPSGSYKSFMALDLAAAVATGQQWHGFDVDGQGPVLYVAAEGAQGLKERAVAWSRHYGRDYGPLVILPVAVMLDDPIMVQWFIEACMKAQEKVGKPFQMVVIDTMARSFNGDENSSQDTGAFINSCSAWRSKLDDCTVLIVAHAGKDVQRGIRGSSALKAACDFVFVVTRPNHLQALFRNEKQKDIDEAEDMRFALQSVHLGIKDHKDRERKSLVPILESKGSMADPDKEDDEEMTVFEVGDLKDLVRIVKANTASGKSMTEDDLKKEFMGKKISEGTKPDSARKSFSRNLAKSKDKGYLMKHGKFISVGDVQI